LSSTAADGFSGRRSSGLVWPKPEGAATETKVARNTSRSAMADCRLPSFDCRLTQGRNSKFEDRNSPDGWAGELIVSRPEFRFSSFEFRISILQFPISNLEFPVSPIGAMAQ